MRTGFHVPRVQFQSSGDPHRLDAALQCSRQGWAGVEDAGALVLALDLPRVQDVECQVQDLVPPLGNFLCCVHHPEVGGRTDAFPPATLVVKVELV